MEVQVSDCRPKKPDAKEGETHENENANNVAFQKEANHRYSEYDNEIPQTNGIQNAQTANGRKEQLHRDVSPQFSIDSDIYELTQSVMPEKLRENNKNPHRPQLITQQGRQLLGNQSSNLHFKKKHSQSRPPLQNEILPGLGNSNPGSELASPAIIDTKHRQNRMLSQGKNNTDRILPSNGNFSLKGVGQRPNLNLQSLEDLLQERDNASSQSRYNDGLRSHNSNRGGNHIFQDPNISVIPKSNNHRNQDINVKEVDTPLYDTMILQDAKPKQGSYITHDLFQSQISNNKNSDSNFNTKDQLVDKRKLVAKIQQSQPLHLRPESLSVPDFKKSPLKRGSKVELRLKNLPVKNDSIVVVDNELNDSDFTSRFQYDINEKPQMDTKRAQLYVINQIAGKVQEGREKDNSFFMIVEKLPIEQIDDIDGRCSKLIRCICFARIQISAIAFFVIKSKVFEAATLMVIITNSIFLAIQDPLSNVTPSYQTKADTMFLVLYSVEMTFKILALGFVFNHGAYLRDPWNILDFFIVMTSYMQYILQGVNFNLSGLRVFRVLRPLRSISNIPGLKVIVSALLDSVKLLRDTLVILFFFFLVYAIAGLQLFQGVLKKRCVQIETGIPAADDNFCGGYNICPDGYFCGKRFENPDYNNVCFDNLLYALLVAFTSCTLEGWSQVMEYIMLSYSTMACFYNISMIIIGGFFLLNLLMTVIESKFSKISKEKKQEREKALDKQPKNIDYVDYWYLKEEEKKKREQTEKELRAKVLKKWQMIIFIKQRMKMRVKDFRLKKSTVQPTITGKDVKFGATFDYSKLFYAQEERLFNGRTLQAFDEDKGEDGNRRSRASNNSNAQRRLNQSYLVEKQEGTLLESPGKRMKMEGIVHGFPRRGLSRTQVFESKRQAFGIHPNMDYARRRLAFNEQFFVDFISKDLEVLEKMFSEEQLRDMAQDLKDAETHSSNDPTDSKDEEKLSSVSINTVEFNTRKNPQSESNSKNSNEERASPSTKIVKKKTRNTMIPESSDLSISNFQENEELEQKVTQAKQNSALMSSNDALLLNGQLSAQVCQQNDEDAKPHSSRAQEIIEAGARTKERLVKTQKTFGSSRIIPINLEAFDARTAHKLSRIRHGANTMYKNDDIQVDQSVLNSRFLISDFLEKKQKIYLLKEKFDFNRASEDIFEQRDAQAKEQRREEARRNATDYKKDWGIKPFQKKLVVKQRVLKADEEQAEYLRHIGMEPTELEQLVQKEYNHPYLSNLLVTGTLSLALKDKALINDKNNRIRRIQNAELQNQHTYQDNSLNRSLSQSSYVQQQSNPLHSQQSSPPPKQSSARSQAVSVKHANDDDQLAKDIKQTVFIKAMHTQSLARSKNKALTSGVYQSLTSLREKSGMSLDNLAKRRALLQKQAAKDPALQKRLILSAINREAKNSRLFMTLYNKRKNRITEGELRHRPTLVGMLDIVEDDEDKDSGKDEEEDSDDDEFGDVFQDAYLDWPIECRVEVLKAKKQALSGKKNHVQWSGQDVLLDYDPQFAKIAMGLISAVRIWPKQLYGYWKRARTPIKALVKSQPFDYFLLAAVFGNTIVLSLDSYGISAAEAAQLSIMNTVFTWIFIVEASLKIIGLGIVKYLRDKMNYLDLTVVLLSIVEMAFQSGKGNLSAFKAVRIFRIFRVLRVARLLKSMKSMQNILKVLMNSMDQFMYVLMLMFLFNFIYALLGMQIYGGNQYFATNYDGPAGIPMENFDTFNAAFLQVFQVITDENWHQRFYDGLRAQTQWWFAALYFMSLIFIGEYMLLNLFIAVLLGGFSGEDEDKAQNIEDLDSKTIKKNLIDKLHSRDGQDLIEFYEEDQDQGKTKVRSSGPSNKKKRKKKRAQNGNILDESFDYEKDAHEIKKLLATKKKKDFEGIYCDYSMYIFSKQNKFRVLLYRMVSSQNFEWVVLGFIVASSIMLVIETYMNGLSANDPRVKAQQFFDMFFTAAFAFESFIKSISFGFVQDKGSYLRDSWSQLDFFIVVTSLIDASFSSVNIPMIKILRMLRTLRPLRFISRNSGMKALVTALLGSAAGFLNILVVVLAVWLIFAILAVNFFGGKMYSCTINSFSVLTEKECIMQHGQWQNNIFNYDSVPNAIFTLFCISTKENWNNYMYNAINAPNDPGGGPSFQNNEIYGYFFVVYMMIGTYLFKNLFIGYIFGEFESAIEEEKAGTQLKDEQIAWIDMMKMIANADPDFETTHRPKAKWRQKVYEFITGENFKHNYFDFFVMGCIILNMFQMAATYEGANLEFNNILDYINYFFTTVFVVEATLKLISYGGTYFSNSWNQFDFFVVVASVLDIIMSFLSAGSLKFLKVGPQLARIMRVFRVSRLFRLINKYKGLQALISTITFSIPAIMSVFSLLLLVYFIFAVLGTFLFSGITKGVTGQIDEIYNFSDFSHSFLLLMRCSTGENWNQVMEDTMQTPSLGCIPNQTCGLSYAPVFWIPFMFISGEIMIQLFVLVIINEFDKYYLSDQNIMETFKTNLQLFKETWTKLTKDQNCLKLKETKMVTFFQTMEKPLGMKGESNNDVIKRIVLMGVQTDEGYVYFHELLFKSMRILYGDMHVRNIILAENEFRTRQIVEQKKLKIMQKSWKEERTKAVQANPFMLQMNMNISFKTWYKQYKKNISKREEQRRLILEGLAPDHMVDVFSNDEPQEVAQEQSLDWEYVTDYDISVDENEESVYGYEQDESDENNKQDYSKMLQSLQSKRKGSPQKERNLSLNQLNSSSSKGYNSQNNSKYSPVSIQKYQPSLEEMADIPYLAQQLSNRSNIHQHSGVSKERQVRSLPPQNKDAEDKFPPEFQTFKLQVKQDLNK